MSCTGFTTLDLVRLMKRWIADDKFMSDDAAANLAIDTVEVAALLLVTPESGARGALLASAVVEVIPDSACAVYRFKTEGSEACWRAVATAGDITLVQNTLATDTRLYLSRSCRDCRSLSRKAAATCSVRTWHISK
jgi:hypothetical protein